MLYFGVDIKKFQTPTQLLPFRRPASAGGVQAKVAKTESLKPKQESDSVKLADSVQIDLPTGQGPVDTNTPSTQSLETHPVRFKEPAQSGPKFDNSPLLMGMEAEPVYMDEIRVLDQRYPGVSDRLKKFEVEAAVQGYCPKESKAVESTLLQSPPWPTTSFGSAWDNISAKAAELQHTHPELKSSDPKDYDFKKANTAAADLMESLDGMFPQDQFPGFAMSARAKAPDSLSKKMEKQVARSDEFSLAHLTDTVGARIDAPDLKGMGEVARKLESHYKGKIVAKSDYISEPGENGYRAIHYVIDIGGRMAEIQTSTTSLRTADLATHDTVYKAEFPVSPQTARELSTAADRIMFLECLKEKGSG